MTRWAELEAALAERIQGGRLAHVYRVLDTARDLADRYGVNREQAEIAALMHDFAKRMSDAELLAEGRQRNLIIDPAEEVQPQLLHGPVAAAQLAELGLVTDPAVLDAIRWHTTGRAGMSRLEMVIWLADYIEPGRVFPGVQEIREQALHDLDGALLKALDGSIAFVLQRGWMLHLYTVHARNWLLTR
ncbi:MAG TPA: bis(5'-nucleosyl)-tetraphosphatase (symmetrical) YqeK [Symbiobacteriaceae bacterium]|nr:bis(5'-nucleosyl)-tetraphosphatase (symmetrical) YqeK [Symbiobacteriaceae bacterium]